MDEVRRRHRLSIPELRAVCQPASVLERRSEEHWTGRLYMRRISIYVTRFALRLGLAPNTITSIMILVGLAGAAVISVDGWVTALAGALLVQIYLCLDCVDGEVARWTARTSAIGVYLDRFGHYLVEASLVVALGVRAAHGEAAWVILGLVGAIFVMLEKVETDLVAVARMSHGLDQTTPGSEQMRSGALAQGRSVARYFPLHLITHAAEASLLIFVVAIVDTVADTTSFTRGLLVVMVVVSGAMVLLHLVSILNSRRLTG
jgi:CDP-alcohol phosphatidyltransferase